MYEALVYSHLITVLAGFVLATTILINKKGTHFHKALGRPYILLMLTTAVITLLMPAHVGPALLGHFGFIHGFSVLTLVSLPIAYFAIRRGNRRSHIANMLGVYVGGILVAGLFAFMPGRLLHSWLFG